MAVAGSAAQDARKHTHPEQAMPILQDLLLVRADDGFRLRGAIDGADLDRDGAATALLVRALALAARDGVAVRLGPGRFPLATVVELPAQAQLIGSGRGTRLDCAPAAGLSVVGGAGVLIADLAVVGADLGIDITAAPQATLREVTVARCATGVRLRDHACLARFTGCTFVANRDVHLHLKDLREGPWGEYLPNLIEGCQFVGGGLGLEAHNAIVVNVVGCSFFQCGRGAIHVHHQSNSVQVTGCRTFQITGDAVVVEEAHEFCCTGNVFCWHTGHGIVVRNASWGTITGNEVIDNGSINPGGPNFTRKLSEFPDAPACDGIRLENCRGFAVTGNAIFNWNIVPEMAVGIRLDAACNDCAVSGNAVNRYREDGDAGTGTGTAIAGTRIVASGNNGRAACHWGAWDRLQTFRTELTDALANALIAR
jgi:nitrous oxidase accessory protein NosD